MPSDRKMPPTGTKRKSAGTSKQDNKKKRETKPAVNRDMDDDNYDDVMPDNYGASMDDVAESTAASSSGNGFAAAMSKVLGRTVTKSNPVLAKRHTAAEKIVAKEKQETKVAKLKTRDKKLARRAHMQLPDVTKQDYERQLKKVATKGGSLCCDTGAYIARCEGTT